MLAWASIAFVVVRIGRTGDTRWWLAAGALVGVGAEFNHLAAVIGVTLLAAVLLGPARRTAADRRLLAGAGVAVLVGDVRATQQHGHGGGRDRGEQLGPPRTSELPRGHAAHDHRAGGGERR
ncbi:glycosyltransferase family 39 protein, partial [Streptomyces sp. NPDC006875]|uniref:glycosyltransferase family 39 protein n=1 Tax=Streptomyces sp. NPDC006875 TaxID=3154781 RepID=UPI0033D07293